MKFYRSTAEYSGGIDLHTRQMNACVNVRVKPPHSKIPFDS